MSLREKIGQLVQLDLATFVDQNTAVLDERRLTYYIHKYKIGSFMNNFYDKMDAPPPDPKTWVTVLNKVQQEYRRTRLQIPMIYGLDCIHGANYIYGATLFPQQLGIASSFNRNLTRLIGEITAKDTRAVGVHWNFSPVLDIAVNKQWGRVFETFGEDPYVASELGRAIIHGYQGYPQNLSSNNRVAATMKHFIGYSATHSGKDVDGSWISDRIVYDYFEPSFDAAVSSDVATAMESYSDIAGDHLVKSKKYLVELLRKKMNFTGVLITDWGQIEKLHKPIRIAKTPKDAVRYAMKLGSIDFTMVPTSMEFIDYMEQLVNEKEIPSEFVDKSVLRILRLKEKLGLFENFGLVEDLSPLHTIGSALDNMVSLAAAKEGVILLKNVNNTLPLKLDRNIFVTGPTATSIRFLNGGWTFKWPGPKDDTWFTKGRTILDSIKKTSNNKVTHMDSVDIKGNVINDIDLVKEAIEKEKAEVIVLCLGEENYVELLGDINDMYLPKGQIELIDQLSETQVPIVLILSQGRPRALGNVIKKTNAILNGFLLGPHGGDAFSDVLFGKHNPSGKLPLTYSNHPNDNTLNYFRRANENYQVEWPFGFGLSYTGFKYSQLKISSHYLTENTSLTVSVKVENTGAMGGKEVVMMFITDLYRSIAPEAKKLKGFSKIYLGPGESETVKFSINIKDTAFYDEDNLWRAEAGEFVIEIAYLKINFELDLEAKEFVYL